MRVLIGCETSGVSRRAFEALGHTVLSCDLLPADDGATNHYQGDIFDVIDDGFDLAIFHPPCTYLTGAGLHWNKRGVLVDGRPRAELTEEAIVFVQRLMGCGIPKWGLENPVGCIGTRIRKADQTIQPYEFGDDASKATCLWLHNLPPLVKDPARRFHGRMVIDPRNGKLVERWSNQTDSGQNRLPPSADRWKLRSETYPGIAAAWAWQWGGPVELWAHPSAEVRS